MNSPQIFVIRRDVDVAAVDLEHLASPFEHTRAVQQLVQGLQMDEV